MKTRGEIEELVFWSVAHAGALTTRRIINQGWLKPHWMNLLTRRLLVERATDYGTVVALTALGREHAHTVDWRYDYPRLNAPSHLAARAFLNDATLRLSDEGYIVHEEHLKRQPNGRAPTSHQITSVTLEVPPARMHHLKAMYPTRRLESSEALGRPRLYACPTGLSSARLLHLFDQHARDVVSWRHPLLVAAPDDVAVRGLLRAGQVNRDPSYRPPARGRRRLSPGDVRLILIPKFV